MPTSLCHEPTCPSPATYRGRCAIHAHERQQTTNLNRAQQRRIYNSKRWANTRRTHLRDHPLCECSNPNCYEIATDVHHRTDIAEGGDPWGPHNLQSLSHACHAAITRANQHPMVGEGR